MLGNDVVDLRDADTRPESFRPRFDERVFAPVERRAIERDARSPGGSHARRWAHWAAKEAAYKLAKQIDSDFVFSPSKLVAHFDSAIEASGGGVERRGTLRLPCAVAQGIQELELRSRETGDRVHVLALPVGVDWQGVVSAVEPIVEAVDPSAAVRRLAIDRIAQGFGIAAERITIGRRGRVPTLSIDGSPRPMAISLSHHGGWVACAMRLRCDGAQSVGPAPVDGDWKTIVRRAMLDRGDPMLSGVVR
ncbi:MAG: 4'-phosphopantetheinyl transferase superfamily protein [bacterium]|nr:4'-phosphopantetheinyl transferase superfamily protein [bacterium]